MEDKDLESGGSERRGEQRWRRKVMLGIYLGSGRARGAFGGRAGTSEISGLSYEYSGCVVYEDLSQKASQISAFTSAFEPELTRENVFGR